MRDSTSRCGPTRGSPLPPDALRDPAVDFGEVDRVVEDVLSRPEYADVEPGLLQRIFDQILEAIARAFDVAAGTGAGRVAGILVLAALAAGLGWLLVRAARRVRWERAAEVEVGGPTGRTPEDWLADADRHERDGDRGEALRCHYRALLAWLAARGVVDEVPGTTTGEYQQAVAAALPEAGPPFADLTAAFERAWYGRQAVSPADLEAAKGAAARTRSTAAAGAGARA